MNSKETINMRRYHLYRVETLKGHETFVVAEDQPRAAEIYICNDPPREGEDRLYRIFLWSKAARESQRIGLTSILTYGPPGIATYCATCGWSVIPPG